MTATNQQPVAEICSASHDDAQFGERAIKPLCDISGFEYGTPLYAGAAPAAVAPQGVAAWMTPEGDRVVTAETMDGARKDGGAVPVVLGKKLFQFSCHQDWVNRAQRAWKMAGVRSEDTICLDQKGRVLRKGLEFARADKEGAFPVVVYLALVDDTAAHDAWLAAQAAAKGASDE